MNQETDSFISSLSQAVRDNPIAAALIGGGALWLMFGNRPIGSMFGGAAAAAETLAESGMRSVASAGDAITSAGSRATDAVMETARSATRAAGEAASSGADSIREHLADTSDRASDSVSRATDRFSRTAEALRSAPNPLPHLQKGFAGTQSTLTALFERQPLAIGAIGLAIGAGVGSAMASTAFENEWAGSLSDDVKEAVKGRAEHVAETAQRAAGEVGSEFRAAAGEAADELRKAGEDSIQSARERADVGRN